MSVRSENNFAYKVNVFLVCTMRSNVAHKVNVFPAVHVFVWSVKPMGWEGGGLVGPGGSGTWKKHETYLISKQNWFLISTNVENNSLYKQLWIQNEQNIRK